MLLALFVFAILLYFFVNMPSDSESGSESNLSENEECLVQKATEESQKDKLVLEKLRELKKRMNTKVKVIASESKARESFNTGEIKASGIKEESQKIKEHYSDDRSKDEDHLNTLKRFKMKCKANMEKKMTEKDRDEMKSDSNGIEGLRSSNKNVLKNMAPEDPIEMKNDNKGTENLRPNNKDLMKKLVQEDRIEIKSDSKGADNLRSNDKIMIKKMTLEYRGEMEKSSKGIQDSTPSKTVKKIREEFETRIKTLAKNSKR